MSVCAACGAVLSEDTRFCQTCGSSIELRESGSKKMDTNVVGALTYLAGAVTGIIFLVLEPYKSNSFVRFHSFQSILFSVAWGVFWIVWMILSAGLTPLTAGVSGLMAPPVMVIFILAGFGTWVFLMYEAYQQKLFRLPIVGRFAAEYAGVRP